VHELEPKLIITIMHGQQHIKICRVLLTFRTQHTHFKVLRFKCDLCSVFNECA